MESITTASGELVIDRCGSRRGLAHHGGSGCRSIEAARRVRRSSSAENPDHACSIGIPHPAEVSLAAVSMQPARRSRSSGPPSTSAPGAAALIWDPRQSAMPAWMAASPTSGTSISTVATSGLRSRRPWRSSTSTPGFCPRSRRLAPRSPSSSPRRPATSRFPSSWGDHSVALGTLGGLPGARPRRGDLDRRSRRPQQPGDKPDGNVHGMVLAAALGLAGDRFRGEGWSAARRRARPRGADRRALARRRRAGAAEGVGRPCLHDERRGSPGREAPFARRSRVAGPGFVHVSLDMDAVDPGRAGRGHPGPRRAVVP